jgi:hypothetical protein
VNRAVKGGITREKLAVSFSRGTVIEGQRTEVVIEGLMLEKRGQLARVEESRHKNKKL